MWQHGLEWLIPFGWVGLFLVSFAEASFLPVAPDWLLIPLIDMEPQDAYGYAALAVTGSLLGSLFGYWIGTRAGAKILHKFLSAQRLEQIRQLLTRFGVWTIVVAGLTPLPFKLFTIASGVFQVRRSRVVLGTLIGRSMRFFGLTVLVRESHVFKISHGMEVDLFTGLPLLLGIVAIYGYVRKKYNRWLRKRLLGLWHFLDSSAEWSMLIACTVCSFLIAVFGGDFLISGLQQAGEATVGRMWPTVLGGLVTILLWAAGCVCNGLVFLYVEERKAY